MLLVPNLKYSQIWSFYLPLILCIISIIGSILFIFSFIKIPSLRINLGKLILIITIIETIFSAFILFSLFYTQNSITVPENRKIIIFTNSGHECIAIGFIFSFCLWNYFFLNFFLCHNLRISFLSNLDNFKLRFKFSNLYWLIIKNFPLN